MSAGRLAPTSQRDEAAAFLEAVFGSKPEAWSVVLWELAGRRSTSFADLAAAADYAAGRADLYVHVGLVSRPYSGPDRPSALEIDGLPGFWGDLDIAHAVHRKGGLCPDEPTALAVARSTGLAPSLVVHSGHGLQAWWLLNEAWTFEDGAERRRGRMTARAWDLSLRERAGRMGYTLDAVGDVSRLLRAPGTLNGKTDPPAPVGLLELNAARYGIDEIEAALCEGAWQQAECEIAGGSGSRAAAATGGDLVLNPLAEPPWDKLDALRDNEPEFDRSWRRKRREPWSPSEYDLSLARYAAMAGWTPQEIVNLCIAWRRKHGEAEKLRQDYYQRLIEKATSDQQGREALGEAVAAAEEVATAGGAALDRAAALASISRGIGVEISRVVRVRSEPPSFRLESPRGSGVLGGIGVFTSNGKFREKVGEITNTLPRRMKSEAWDSIAQALLRVAEEEEPDIEATVHGRIETWLSLYLGQRLPQRIDQLTERDRGGLAHSLHPFIGEDGRVRIFGTGFRRWLGEVQREQVAQNEVYGMLRAYGCSPETRMFRPETGRTSRALWVLPMRDHDESASGEGRPA